MKIRIGDYVYFRHDARWPKWCNWGRVTNILRERRYSRTLFYGIKGSFGLSGNIHPCQILRIDRRRFKEIKKGKRNEHTN